MGCGCRIVEGSPVGAFVDHSECRFSDLQQRLTAASERVKELEVQSREYCDDLERYSRQDAERIATLEASLKDERDWSKRAAEQLEAWLGSARDAVTEDILEEHKKRRATSDVKDAPGRDRSATEGTSRDRQDS